MTPTRSGKARLTRYAPAVLTTSFAINLLMLATPIYMMQIFDRVIVTGSTESLVALTVIALLAVLAFAALDGARGSVLIRMGRWLDDHLSRAVLGRTSADDRPAVAQDISLVRGALCGRTGPMVLDAPWTPVFLLPLLILHPLFALMAVVLAALLVALAIRLDRRDAKTVTATRLALHQAGRALDVSRTSTEPRYLEGAVRLRATGVTLQSRSLEATSGTLSIAKGTRIGAQLIVLALGAWLVINNALSAGGLIAAALLFARAVAPFEQAIGGLRELLAAHEAWGRLEIRSAALAEADRQRTRPHAAANVRVLPAKTHSTTARTEALA